MPSFNGKIARKIQVSIPDRLLNRITERAFLQVSRRINRIEPQIIEKARSLISTAIQNHPVFKGLQRPQELQAEFGLTESMAEKALTRLLDILENTVFVQTAIEKTSSTFRITFQLRALDPEEYEPKLRTGTAPFAYQNTRPPAGPKGKIPAKINWMEWLLDGVAEIVGEYGITYIGTSGEGGLTAKESKRSRSGYALMTNNENFSRNFPYSLPKYVIPSGKAKNFIEEIRNNVAFRKLLGDTIENIIRKEMPRS